MPTIDFKKIGMYCPDIHISYEPRLWSWGVENKPTYSLLFTQASKPKKVKQEIKSVKPILQKIGIKIKSLKNEKRIIKPNRGNLNRGKHFYLQKCR